MDIERGNIEILFQKIPYMYLLAPKDCSESFLGYNKVDEGLYMRYAADVFTCYLIHVIVSNEFLFCCV